MVNRHNRLLVTFHVLTDAVLASCAFLLAFLVRFESGLVPVTKGYPPLQQYVDMLPFIALLTPLAFQFQGLYRLRRGTSRSDVFFALLVGTVLAVVLTAASLLYVQAYFSSDEAKASGALEVSQPVWGLFLLFTVAFTYASREGIRQILEHRWRAGIGLRRVVIAGTGPLGRTVAERILEHRALGYQVVGFLDDEERDGADLPRGAPVLGTLRDVVTVVKRERINHVYAALPAEKHLALLSLIEETSRECIDVKVVPDLLQFIALRARLEDLDGLPVVNINDVPLQGVNAWVKRALDVVISVAGLLVLAVPLAIIAALVRLTSPGPVFYRQERMGLDGTAFTVYKFRSMPVNAEETSGPVWGDKHDPRATPLGLWLRRLDLDELPQLWNVLRGDMSIVGPRPERPFFVEQFKHRLPQYMLRHKVKAGITGWAQVNGWRGNTSLEKRLEYDLYYIENWSVTLDLKIMWLTLVRGLFPRGVA